MKLCAYLLTPMLISSAFGLLAPIIVAPSFVAVVPSVRSLVVSSGRLGLVVARRSSFVRKLPQHNKQVYIQQGQFWRVSVPLQSGLASGWITES
jgi:hypothetical protein